MQNNCIAECMLRYVGQTVTIFTSSGGLSGAGFTGVLACVDGRVARLITAIGAPPSCPIGSSCIGFGGANNFNGFNSFGGFNGFGSGWGIGESFLGNPLGSVCEIPISSIVSFTHCSI